MKRLTLGALALCSASPAFAQDEVTLETQQDVPPVGDTVFDGDWVSIGIGAAYSPSYSGSDDYVISVLPIVQGSFGGVDISPRPGGLALDFIPDSDEGPNFDFGIVAKINRDRVSQIEDPIVKTYGELDTAIEVGPTAGVSFPGLLNPYDSLSVSVDAAWDIAGAHEGMTVSPSVTYFTPVSRGAAVSLSASTTWVDDSYADYYYSVPAINTLLPAPDLLPAFQAEGGFESVGLTALLGVDLNGDITDGGLALIGIGGYSRMLGDAKRTPFTSIRGDADQFFVAAGIGYTF